MPLYSEFEFQALFTEWYSLMPLPMLLQYFKGTQTLRTTFHRFYLLMKSSQNSVIRTCSNRIYHQSIIAFQKFRTFGGFQIEILQRIPIAL